MTSASPDDPTGVGRAAALLAAGLEVRDVVHDSREVTPGAVYVAFRGAHFDGHRFVEDAVAAGASAVITDEPVEVSVPSIVVDDTRLRIGPLASLLLGSPSEQLVVVGITGTNGKTTTAQFVDTILRRAGWQTGVIGTLHGPRTTPEAPDLQRRLRGFADAGARAAVLEVSSHALALHRVDGTRFDAVVFTNLGHDHLDLHGSHEAYFRAKASLFDPSFAPLGLINVDDPHGRLLADTLSSIADRFRVVPLSLDDVADVEVSAASHSYRWRGHRVEVPIGGRFNVANSLAAISTAVELGIDPTTAVAALRDLPVVPGRFEVVRDRNPTGVTVVVDYAHTPDGLDEVLSSARAVAGDGSVIAVFGCGGDRDRRKRPEMGAVAARAADRVVITSDNPRSESPDAIIGDILDGVPGEYRARVVTIPDRRAAIRDAIGAARAGDIVVVAGKGHETTQEYADRTVAFDDREIAAAVIDELSEQIAGGRE